MRKEIDDRWLDVPAVVIELPHPSGKLGGNGRVHWSVKHKLSHAVKVAAKLLALRCIEEHGYPVTESPSRYRVQWFYKGCRPDDDNVLSRCKYVKDGMCEALGIDDAQLSLDGIELLHDKVLAGTVRFWIY